MRCALVAAVASACVAQEPAFTCACDDSCVRAGVQGTCDGGFCSFPDPSCASTRRRYGEHAGGGLAGRCVPGCTATLDDDFAGQALDPGRWTVYGMATASGGAAAFALDGAPDRFSGVVSRDPPLAIAGRRVVAHACRIPSASSDAFAALYVRRFDDDTQEIAIRAERGRLEFRRRQGGTSEPLGDSGVMFDPVQHRYWQLREQGGTSVWETSSDGAVWTTRATVSTPAGLTSIRVGLDAGTNASSTEATSARFDHLTVCAAE